MFKLIKKSVSIVILAAFFSTSVKSPAMAQLSEDPMPFMSKPGVMVPLSSTFTPAYLKGIVIHPEDALKFDFIIYKGDQELNDDQKRDEYTRLTKYFLASLAIPDDDQWVNLSPYEKDRIIKDDFGKTEMGRDLLAQDYMLKQITASLIYPQDALGKKFWDKIYTEAQKQYGTTDIPVNTFNKVWILPDDALIYEKGNTAYVLKNHLRVMLEEDYLSLKKHAGIQSAPMDNKTHTIASKIIKEIVLPELEREVNEDKNFATVRQVYSGMLLATWYKRALKESLLSKVYADKSQVKGVDQNPQNNETIYRQYLKAYKKGVFNFIQEDVDKYTNETIPRKYFSGGGESIQMAAEMENRPVMGQEGSNAVVQVTTDAAKLTGENPSTVDLASIDAEEEPVIEAAKQVPQAASSTITTPATDTAMAAQTIVPDTNGEVIFEPNTKAVTIRGEGGLKVTLYRPANNSYLVSYGYENETSRTPLVIPLVDNFTSPKMKVTISRHDGNRFTIVNDRATDIVVTGDNAMATQTIIPDTNGEVVFGPNTKVVTIKGENGLNITLYRPDDLSYLVSYGYENEKSATPLVVPLVDNFTSPKMKVTISKHDGNRFTIVNDRATDIVVTTDKAMSSFAADQKAEKALQDLYTGTGEVGARELMEALLHKTGYQHGNIYKEDEFDGFVNAVKNLHNTNPSPALAHAIDVLQAKKPTFIAAINASEGRITDQAQLTNIPKPAGFTRGGIDFNSANLSLQIKRDGHGVPLPIDQQDLENIKIDGLIPVIIDIKPAANLPIFAELQNTPS